MEAVLDHPLDPSSVTSQAAERNKTRVLNIPEAKTEILPFSRENNSVIHQEQNPTETKHQNKTLEEPNKKLIPNKEIKSFDGLAPLARLSSLIDGLQKDRDNFVTLQIFLGESIPAIISGLFVNPRFACEEAFKETCKILLRIEKNTTEDFLADIAAQSCLPQKLRKNHKVFLHWDDKDCLNQEAGAQAMKKKQSLYY